MDQVVFHAGQRRIVVTEIDQILAQRHEGAGSARRQIETAKQLLPRRLDGAEQRLQAASIGSLLIGRPSLLQLLRIGTEIPRQGLKERLPLRFRHGGISIQHLAGERDTGGFAAP